MTFINSPGLDTNTTRTHFRSAHVWTAAVPAVRLQSRHHSMPRRRTHARGHAQPMQACSHRLTMARLTNVSTKALFLVRKSAPSTTSTAGRACLAANRTELSQMRFERSPMALRAAHTHTHTHTHRVRVRVAPIPKHDKSVEPSGGPLVRAFIRQDEVQFCSECSCELQLLASVCRPISKPYADDALKPAPRQHESAVSRATSARRNSSPNPPLLTLSLA